MNKDALLATLIGFGIGLLITGLLLLGPNLMSFLPKITLPSFVTNSTNTQGNKVTPTPKPSQFEIKSPLPESIESVEGLLVSGTAPQGSTIVIAGFNDETVVVVGNDGTFAGKVLLSEGKNDISVTAILKSTIETKTVTVYFTEEKV